MDVYERDIQDGQHQELQQEEPWNSRCKRDRDVGEDENENNRMRHIPSPLDLGLLNKWFEENERSKGWPITGRRCLRNQP